MIATATFSESGLYEPPLTFAFKSWTFEALPESASLSGLLLVFCRFVANTTASVDGTCGVLACGATAEVDEVPGTASTLAANRLPIFDMLMVLFPDNYDKRLRVVTCVPSHLNP